MTVKKAMETAQLRLPGTSYTQEDMLGWLRGLERIWAEFLDRLGYKAEEKVIDKDNTEQELYVDSPNDEMYIMWLVMKMHYYNGEIDLYNNAAQSFNNSLEEAKKSFIRQNRSKKQHSFKGFREV